MEPTLQSDRHSTVTGNSEQHKEPILPASRTDESLRQFRDFEIPPPQPPWRMRLDPPIEFDGAQYAELIFDFDAMTTKDFIRAHREFTHRYKPERDEIPFPDVNPLYHAIIAAHRANVPLGVIDRLTSRYWSPLRTQILKACGGSPEDEKK